MVDLNVLVPGLTSFLAPLMPYLATAGQKVAEGVGTATWEKAQEIWGKLHPKVTAKPAAQEAAQDLATQPNNEAFKTVFSVQLEKLLRDDATLANELQALLSKALEAERESTYKVVFNQPGANIGGDAYQAGRDINIGREPKQD